LVQFPSFICPFRKIGRPVDHRRPARKARSDLARSFSQNRKVRSKKSGQESSGGKNEWRNEKPLEATCFIRKVKRVDPSSDMSLNCLRPSTCSGTNRTHRVAIQDQKQANVAFLSKCLKNVSES
jgi:hypothetical protein